MTRRKSSKKTRLCDFSHRHGNFEDTTVADGRLRTVANGCERLRTVANGCNRLRTPEAGSREHGSPPNVKREPFATHSGKMFLKDFLYICLNGPTSLEHGKIEENSVNSSVFKGLGRQGNLETL